MIPIYLAAPWVDRESARATARIFGEAGFLITEPWWTHPDTTDHEQLQDQAWKDLRGVAEADVVIVLNTAKSEGKAVEMGYALALNIPIIVVGDRTNIFHHMPEVVVVETVEDAINVIRR